MGKAHYLSKYCSRSHRGDNKSIWGAKMKITSLVVFLVLSLAVGANAKTHPDSEFVDAKYLGKKQISLGTGCSGDSGDCDPVIRYRYTVVSEGVEYVLAPVHRTVFSRDSVLSNVRPGILVKMRMGKGTAAYIKIQERESRYEVVGSAEVAGK